MSEVKIEENIIRNVIGKGIPKTKNDQNTDDIIPARFMKEITFANMCQKHEILQYASS